MSELALRTQSDDRLIALTRAGYTQAFGELARRHHQKLLGYTRRIVGSDHADDIVQQSLLRALRSLEREGDDIREPLAWLYRICHNQSVNYLKSRREHFQLKEHDEKVDSVRQPQQILEQREELRKVVVMMQDLPERQRINLALQAFGGLSYDEVADQVGETVPVVRNLICRARNGLRQAVGAVVPFSLVEKMIAAGSVSSPEAAVGFAYAFSGSGRSLATIAAVVAISTAGGVAVVEHTTNQPSNSAAASVANDSSNSGAGADSSGTVAVKDPLSDIDLGGEFGQTEVKNHSNRATADKGEGVDPDSFDRYDDDDSYYDEDSSPDDRYSDDYSDESDDRHYDHPEADFRDHSDSYDDPYYDGGGSEENYDYGASEPSESYEDSYSEPPPPKPSYQPRRQSPQPYYDRGGQDGGSSQGGGSGQVYTPPPADNGSSGESGDSGQYEDGGGEVTVY